MGPVSNFWVVLVFIYHLRPWKQEVFHLISAPIWQFATLRLTTVSNLREMSETEFLRTAWHFRSWVIHGPDVIGGRDIYWVLLQTEAERRNKHWRRWTGGGMKKGVLTQPLLVNASPGGHLADSLCCWDVSKQWKTEVKLIEGWSGGGGESGRAA